MLNRFYRRYGKRLLDIAASIALLISLSPLLLLTALLVRLNLGAPVLFKQCRPGKAGRPFTMYKFRTMRDARDSRGEPLPDADRLTRFGTFLRKASLDELPELWNVLLGQMSLVGPRPLLVSYLPLYSAEQARRHEVRPGLTGLAQVSGRNAISWDEKFLHDLEYVDNLSFKIDAKILLLTVVRVFQRDGISAPEHSTMPIFTGQGDNASRSEAA